MDVSFLFPGKYICFSQYVSSEHKKDTIWKSQKDL